MRTSFSLILPHGIVYPSHSTVHLSRSCHDFGPTATLPDTGSEVTFGNTAPSVCGTALTAQLLCATNGQDTWTPTGANARHRSCKAPAVKTPGSKLCGVCLCPAIYISLLTGQRAKLIAQPSTPYSSHHTRTCQVPTSEASWAKH